VTAAANDRAADKAREALPEVGGGKVVGARTGDAAGAPGAGAPGAGAPGTSNDVEGLKDTISLGMLEGGDD
jgi:hypothetical protein